MKQKYSILKDGGSNQLIIREYAELDKEILSLLCEETYENAAVKSAINAGKEAVIATLRTNNLYPPGIYAEKIADAVINFYGSKGKESVDLFFDDIELLTRKSKIKPVVEEIEDDSTDLDELLEDDFDETYQEKNEIKNLNSSLKIADDDFEDVDDAN
jgi:hypothetical protein